MKTTVLYVGDIVSKAGIFSIKKGLPLLKEKHRIDFIIAGANSVTNGFGLGLNHAIYLKKLGVHSLTLGDNAFFQKDLNESFSKISHVLRPANYPLGVPGQGWHIYKVNGLVFAVIVLLGQSGFSRVHVENPFHSFDRSLAKIKEKGINLIFVDFWACTTAEKNTFFQYAQGQVTAVLGSWGRVLTADAQVKHSTAMITGTGRTGSFSSVGGFDPDTEIYRHKMSMFPRNVDTWEDLELQGILVECNKETGEALTIQLIKLPIERDLIAEL